MSKENKIFLVYLAKYLGVALISGSVVHIGTLEGGATRYAVLMGVGLVLMTLGNIAEAVQTGTKVNVRFLAVVTCLSLSTGFLSGGVQHYLDNPVYAGYLLAIGMVVTYVTLFMKDGIGLIRKDILVVGAVALFILLGSHVVSYELSGDGHADHTH